MARYPNLLLKTREAPTNALPATGMALEWEKLLSAAFIRLPRYGTHVGTILCIHHDRYFNVTKRRFDTRDRIGGTHYLSVPDTATHTDIQALPTQAASYSALMA